MKRTLLAAILTLTALSATFGQGRPDRGTPPTAEQMVQRRVQMLTTLLTLDTAQQARATTIFTEEHAAAQSLRENARTAHEALQTAIQNSAADAQIDQLAAAVGTIQGQALAVHAKARVKLRNMLNSTQKEKLDTIGPRHGMGRGMMGPGMMGSARRGFGPGADF